MEEDREQELQTMEEDKEQEPQIVEEDREQELQTEEVLESFIPPLPRSYGWWSGSRGNSAWQFDLNAQRWDFYNNRFDTWGNVIAQSEYPRADRVDFRQYYPDFTCYIVSVTNTPLRLEVDGDYVLPPRSMISPNRDWNFRQADGWVAQRVRATAGDISYLRQSRKLTWHEMETCNRMILVPRAIHEYVPHGGGIEVINRGPIGAGPIDSLIMEESVVDGKSAMRGMGICRITYSLAVRGTLREIPVDYYCDDDNGIPAQLQLERMRLLEQSWYQTEENAWNTLQRYVDEEWSELYGKGCGKTAELSSIHIFQVNTATNTIDIGFLYQNFAGDPEHGLGVRILGGQGDAMVAGIGDIAL